MKYVAKSPTSREAAWFAEPFANSKREKIFLYLLRSNNGATDHEIQREVNIQPSTERPRRGDLVDVGLVEDSGRTRKTASGRQAVVWVACDKKHRKGMFSGSKKKRKKAAEKKVVVAAYSYKRNPGPYTQGLVLKTALALEGSKP